MNKVDDKDLRLISFRASESMIKEIDKTWMDNGGFITRSQGLRWLIRKGLEAVNGSD